MWLTDKDLRKRSMAEARMAAPKVPRTEPAPAATASAAAATPPPVAQPAAAPPVREASSPFAIPGYNLALDAAERRAKLIREDKAWAWCGQVEEVVHFGKDAGGQDTLYYPVSGLEIALNRFIQRAMWNDVPLERSSHPIEDVRVLLLVKKLSVIIVMLLTASSMASAL